MPSWAVVIDYYKKITIVYLFENEINLFTYKIHFGRFFGDVTLVCLGRGRHTQKSIWQGHDAILFQPNAIF